MPAALKLDTQTQRLRVSEWKLEDNAAYHWEEVDFVLLSVATESFAKAGRKRVPFNLSELLRQHAVRSRLQLGMLEELLDQLDRGDEDAVMLVVRRLGLETPEEEVYEGRSAGALGARAFVLRQQLRKTAARCVREWRRKVGRVHGLERRRLALLLRRVTVEAGRPAEGPPTRRGRPSPAGDPRNIVVEYRRQLFLWRQVYGLLRSWPGSHQERLRFVVDHYALGAVAKGTRLTLGRLLEYVGIQPDGRLTGTQQLPDWQLARILTARRFRITQARVDNVISAYVLAEGPAPNFVK